MSNFIKSRILPGKRIILKSFFILGSLLFLSGICSAQWTSTSNGLPSGSSATCFAVAGSNLLAGTNYFAQGVYLSANDGSTWAISNIGLGDAVARSFLINGSNIFAGTNGYGIFVSANSGASWTTVSAGLPGVNVGPMAASGASILASLIGYGIYKTSNNGTNWTPSGNGIPAGADIYSLLVNGANVFAGTANYGIYMSANNGANWTAMNNGFPLSNGVVNSLAVIGANIFAATSDGGIYLSANNGASWAPVNNGLPPLTSTGFVSLAISGINIFVGTIYGFGVYISTNNGAGWSAVNNGFPNNSVSTLAVKGSYLFAGMQNNGVWRRNLSEMVGINQISEILPTSYSLKQNYPNPFNPSTKFKFQISKLTNAKVTVFDVLGRVVEILVNEQLQPGTYEADWNAADYPSGTYFYKLSAGDFTETKRMVLIK